MCTTLHLLLVKFTQEFNYVDLVLAQAFTSSGRLPMSSECMLSVRRKHSRHHRSANLLHHLCVASPTLQAKELLNQLQVYVAFLYLPRSPTFMWFFFCWKCTSKNQTFISRWHTYMTDVLYFTVTTTAPGTTSTAVTTTAPGSTTSKCHWLVRTALLGWCCLRIRKRECSKASRQEHVANNATARMSLIVNLVLLL